MEIRTGRKELAAQTMRKFAATMDADRLAANLHPNAQGDGIEPIVVSRAGADNGDETLFQDSIERAGRQLDSPEMAEARRKAAEAEEAGDEDEVAKQTAKFYALRDADPRFQKVLWLPYWKLPMRMKGAQ